MGRKGIHPAVMAIAISLMLCGCGAGGSAGPGGAGGPPGPPTGTISGTVTDSGRGALPGVEVTATAGAASGAVLA